MKVKESYVFLEDIRFHAFHGVMEQERMTGGDFIVRLKVKFPFAPSLQSDNVQDTLNYAQLHEIINKEMQTPSNLLEHLAGRIGESIFKQIPQAEEVWMKITKCCPPMGGDMVGAGIEVRLNNDKTAD